MLQENNLEAARDYLGTLYGQYGTAKRITYCGNAMLNMLLGRYADIAEQKKISFHVDIRKETLAFMDDEDIVTLFGNLLDNAFSAAGGTKEPYIDLRVEKRGDMQFISVVNSCEKEPEILTDGLIKSSKNDGGRHGYGTKSIRKTALKYNGSVDYYYDESEKAFHGIIELKCM